jgi:NitT/TauT family transport system substrate-binding protein
VFGGAMSAAVAYLRRDFLERNPNTVQALVNAFYRTLRWLETASPEQVADTVPQEYWLGDKALYLAAVQANLQVYSRDGVVSEGSRTRSLRFLRELDKEMAAAQVDPAKTWDGRFIAKAAMAAR